MTLLYCGVLSCNTFCSTAYTFGTDRILLTELVYIYICVLFENKENVSCMEKFGKQIPFPTRTLLKMETIEGIIGRVIEHVKWIL
jgi:hypothetical protein